MLIGYPGLVEFLQMLGHVVDDFLHGYVNVVFNDALVYVSDHALNDAELLKKLPASVQDLLREDIFLTIHPQIGEALLGRVEDLGQVAERSFLVEDLIGLGELFPVIPRGA